MTRSRCGKLVFQLLYSVMWYKNTNYGTVVQIKSDNPNWTNNGLQAEQLAVQLSGYNVKFLVPSTVLAISPGTLGVPKGKIDSIITNVVKYKLPAVIPGLMDAGQRRKAI